MTLKLFISYRSLDSAKVDALVTRLRSLKNGDGTARYDPWQDKTSIPVGQDWWKAIVSAIIECDIFVFMLSRESAQNVNCRAELSYARKRNRPIIPLVLEDEFAYNPLTGKNDIAYWDALPPELTDARFQFLFYEGTSFVNHLNAAVDLIQGQTWRDMPAPEPPDPRHANDASNNTSLIYDQACDYAWRLELTTAEKFFQRLVDWRDPLFGDDAHEWIVLLRQYEQLVRLDERANTRYKIPALWETYSKHFPKPFVEFFDPKDFKGRYVGAQSVAPSTPSSVGAQYIAPALSIRNKVVELLPAPFDWVDIPAGKVTLTPDDYDKENSYLKVDTTFEVPAFAIAKYPITNAQFAKFVEAGGYRERQWWTEAGWQAREEGWAWVGSDWKATGKAWAEPLYWRDKKWNGAEYPVVGVSWYEALAFCIWLTATVGVQHVAPLQQITLPTEQQWQHAAQCNTGRTYPWGEGIDPSYANYDASKIGKTTPVTQYPKGTTPEGVYDLAGNVWEWCLTAYETGSQEVAGNNNRLLRGGSWSYDLDAARAAYRGSGYPHSRDLSYGFRVCCVRPPSK